MSGAVTAALVRPGRSVRSKSRERSVPFRTSAVPTDPRRNGRAPTEPVRSFLPPREWFLMSRPVSERFLTSLPVINSRPSAPAVPPSATNSAISPAARRFDPAPGSCRKGSCDVEADEAPAVIGGAGGCLSLAEADGRYAASGMKEVRTEIEIGAAPQRVWGVLMDFGSYPEWNPFIRRISGEPAVGSQLEVRNEPPGGRAMPVKPLVPKGEG